MRIINILLLAIAVTAAAPSAAGAYTITLTRQDVQSQIDPQFPITEETLFSSVTLKNPKLDLTEGSDRIGIIVDAAVSALGGIEAAGLVHIDGALRYVKETGEFLLNDATARSVEIEGLSGMARAKVAEMLTAVIRDYFDKNPIFRLKKDTIAEAMVMSALKSVTVKDGKLQLELGLP
ncbi:MAG: DUF1439 domain-containing protein [Nitrospinota bacterium]|nr:DUF1439 domain-containing protein [Nitrospinota bacterium]